MPHTSRKKKRRSSFFVNPESCEVLFRRTSITRCAPDRRRRLKNESALVSANPIVNSRTVTTLSRCGKAIHLVRRTRSARTAYRTLARPAHAGHGRDRSPEAPSSSGAASRLPAQLLKTHRRGYGRSPVAGPEAAAHEDCSMTGHSRPAHTELAGGASCGDPALTIERRTVGPATCVPRRIRPRDLHDLSPHGRIQPPVNQRDRRQNVQGVLFGDLPVDLRRMSGRVAKCSKEPLIRFIRPVCSLRSLSVRRN